MFGTLTRSSSVKESILSILSYPAFTMSDAVDTPKLGIFCAARTNSSLIDLLA